MQPERIAVIGSGAWGTALAAAAATAAREVVIGGRDPEVVGEINLLHTNRAYLGGVALAPTIRALPLAEAVRGVDLVVMDFAMPGMNGFDGLEMALAASGGRPVAIISGIAPTGVGPRALDIGAAGFLPKTMPAKSLINAIRFMAAGEKFLPIEHGRAAQQNESSGPFDERLTPRERQVLRSLCLGLSNKEIARELSLSEPTVKLHVKMVCRKLDARNRTHAAMLAKEAGFC